MPVIKNSSPVKIKNPILQDIKNYVFTGTKVIGGYGMGVVIATGQNTELGKISKELLLPSPETDFQKGIKKFSSMLLKVTLLLTVFIFLANALLKHDLLESLLFSLAVAIGLTPELLPIIVTTGLARGAKLMAKKEVLVKRLVSIEDFGNMDVLCTDKTGTLTEGKIALINFFDLEDRIDHSLLENSLLCNSVEDSKKLYGTNSMDLAIWERARQSHPKIIAELRGFKKVDEVPFDFSKRRMSVLVRKNSKSILITKGAPESVLGLCTHVKNKNRLEPIAKYRQKIIRKYNELSEEGYLVIAIGYKECKDNCIKNRNEAGLIFQGFLTFLDPPKKTAISSMQRLRQLNVDLKVLTGDNALVAKKVCEELKIHVSRILSGEQIAKMGDEELRKAVNSVTVFARITPEQKVRVIRSLKQNGRVVGFLGDGVNDASALHEADVGISVNTATDVAKDAADIVLLRKSLDVLAQGIVEGRKIFANTLKYIMMGTSSNFGNMFSVAGASMFLKFLPMLPKQILLTNFIYDVSEITVSTDSVDEEDLRKPKKWNVKAIKRFMVFFGPISSLYDFLTYGVMLFIFHASPALFQTGWFIESLCTEIFVIFLIRTKRLPFFKSRPSKYLLLTSLAGVAFAIAIPFTFLGKFFGFVAPPLLFFGVLILMVLTYLLLVELGKYYFFRKYEI